MTKRRKLLSGAETNRRLMQQWTFDVANSLMTEGDMTRRGAFLQAYLLRNLMEALGRGVVQFVYETKDGERREARGTLCRGVSAAFDAYEYKQDGDMRRANTDGLNYVYWDLDKEGFRTFSGERVKEINRGFLRKEIIRN